MERCGTQRTYPTADPLRSVTRAMSKLNSLLKTTTTPSAPTKVATEAATVPRVQAKQQVPRVKQQVPRVTKSQPTQPKHQGILKPPTKSENGPASRTRSQTKAEPVASRTRSRKIQEIAAAATIKAHRRTPAQKRVMRRLSTKIEKWEREVEQALAVMDQQTGKLLNYRQLRRDPKHKQDWSLSSANEFGRLANGIGGRIKNPTNTIKFLRREQVPESRRKDVTYGQFVCSVRPEKKEKNRTRLVVGGDRINYIGEVATPTADMLIAKLLFNSVISTKGSRFMTMDISNFYLNTPLTRPEYIKLKLEDIPDEVINEYNLRDKVDSNGYVHIEATKGMYGLPQAGRLANKLLEKRLNKSGYYQSKLVPGLWKHKWRPVQFTLVVDDFGVKYEGREHAEHLASVLKKFYNVTEEWEGNRYCIYLAWYFDV